MKFHDNPSRANCVIACGLTNVTIRYFAVHFECEPESVILICL